MANCKIEVTKNGILIVSASGNKYTFDANYELIELIKEAKPSWLKWFFLMDEKEREEVKRWYKTWESKNDIQESFKAQVSAALEAVNYDYRISTLEPSINARGQFYYQKGKPVASEGTRTEILIKEWEEKAIRFAPNYKSNIATEHELVLWYAYRVVKGWWTVENVCGNTLMVTSALSGAREYGGFLAGEANTPKLVRCSDHNGGYWVYGTHSYDGTDDHITVITRGREKESLRDDMCAVITLKNVI